MRGATIPPSREGGRLILAGIDEAGYGPILGPLCTGAAAFRVEGGGGPGAPPAPRGPGGGGGAPAAGARI